MNKILLILNDNLLFGSLKTFKLNKNVKKETDIYVYTSIRKCIYNIYKFRRPPIVIDSIYNMDILQKNYEVKSLDFEFNKGVCTEKILSRSKLYSILQQNFKYDSPYILAKNQIFGNNSELGIILDNLLKSLPILAYEAFLISLTRAIMKDDYEDFNNFLKDNRLITKENTSFIKELENFLNLNYCKFKKWVNSDIKEIVDDNGILVCYMVSRFNRKLKVDKDNNLIY